MVKKRICTECGKEVKIGEAEEIATKFCICKECFKNDMQNRH